MKQQIRMASVKKRCVGSNKNKNSQAKSESLAGAEKPVVCHSLHPEIHSVQVILT